MTLPAQNNTRKIQCLEELCGLEFLTKDALRKHLIKHRIKQDYESLLFSNINEFELWRLKMEEETNTNYIRAKCRKSNFVETIYFECNRSGLSRKSEHGKRPPRIKGSCKIGTVCTSQIIARVGEEEVNVQFFKSHYGHRLQLEYLRINPRVRKDVAGKLDLGMTPSQILRTFRGNIGEELKRADLMSKKDINNIAKSLNIVVKQGQRHPNDAISVCLFVLECEGKGDENPVIFFKGQGEISETFPLASQDFCLILMNKAQKDMLNKFGKVVCVDSTQGVNAYDFELTTLLVLDEYNEGFPVAFMFSNRKDSVIFEVFFSKIKDSTGPCECHYFMSDITDTIYTEWTKVMGPAVQQRMFSTWHIFKAWTINLSKIKNSVKRKKVLELCKILQEIKQEVVFKIKFEEILDQLMQDEDTKEFGIYFYKYYAADFKLWASCFRLECPEDTNMHLEKLHKTLKYENLKGVKVMRLDSSIFTLLEFLEDKQLQRIQILTEEKNKQVNSFRERHEAALKSKMSLVTEEDGSYVVNTYRIKKLKDVICCQIVCEDCDICLHMFTCECMDRVNKFICKHIHYVVINTYKNTREKTGEIQDVQLEDVHLHLENLKSKNRADAEIKGEILECLITCSNLLNYVNSENLIEILNSVKELQRNINLHVEGNQPCSSDVHFSKEGITVLEPVNKKIIFNKDKFKLSKNRELERSKQARVSNSLFEPDLIILDATNNDHNYCT